MKVKSNPAAGPVMYPFVRGLYVGCALDPEATEKAGAPTFVYDAEPMELLAAGETPETFFKKRPHDYAYFAKKVQEGELFAADAEMAKAADRPFAAPKATKPAA